MKSIKAKVLSVIGAGSSGMNTVHVGVSWDSAKEPIDDDEYFTLTLRFDRGDKVQLCGYPRHLKLHDDEEVFTFIEEADITAGDEIKILKDCLKDLKRQFKTSEYKKYHSVQQRKDAIIKIENAITALELGE